MRRFANWDVKYVEPTRAIKLALSSLTTLNAKQAVDLVTCKAQEMHPLLSHLNTGARCMIECI